MPSPIPAPPPFATSLVAGLVSNVSQQFSGPKEFLGKIQATGNPIGLGTFTTAGLPAAASHPGAILYNSDLAKIQFSNGSVWAALDAGAGAFVQISGDTMTGQLNIVGAGINVDMADNTFVVDATANRVGILTPSPTVPLDVNGDARIVGSLNLFSALGDSKLKIFDDGMATVGIGYQADDFRFHLNDTGDKFSFHATPAGASLFDMLGTGFFQPGADLGASLGGVGKRFTSLYGATLKDGTGQNRQLFVTGQGNVYIEGIAAPTNSSIAHIFNTIAGYPTGGKLLQALNSSSERFYVDADGNTHGVGNVSAGQSLIAAADLVVDTDLLYADSTNDFVGISTTSPTHKLNIVGGQLKVEGVNDEASIRLQRTETVDGSINPEFKIGSIISGGVNLPMLRFTFTDQTYTDKNCFIIESSGTVASVSDGTRRSHYEAFLQDGDVDPVFRINSSPFLTYEGGPGGAIVSVGGLTRVSNVTTAVTDTPHGLGIGSQFHISHSETDFPAVIVTTKTVASVIDPNTFTYADVGIDATSTIVHHISGITDMQLSRIGPFTARMALGGGAKTTWYPDSFVCEPGIDLFVNNVSSQPLLWASAGFNRVAMGHNTPSAKLHVKGTATAELVSIFQSPASHTNAITEWWNSSGDMLGRFDQNGVMTLETSYNVQETGTVGSQTDPVFAMGRLDADPATDLPLMRFLYRDDVITERLVAAIEAGGTISSIGDGSARRHFQAFLDATDLGDDAPVFVVTSDPVPQIMLGPGGGSFPDTSIARIGSSQLALRTDDFDRVIIDGNAQQMFTVLGDAKVNGKVTSGSLEVSVGGPTGFTVIHNGDIRRASFHVQVDATALTAAALSEDIVICSVPARSRIVAVYTESHSWSGGGSTTVTLRLGHTVGGTEFILDHEVSSGNTFKGNADGDLGTALARATAVQGSYLSVGAPTVIRARFTSDVNVADLTDGFTDFYIIVEHLEGGF